MHVTWKCPDCEQTSRQGLDDRVELVCPGCDRRWPLAEAVSAPGEVERCVVCRGTDLFVRKDFSQRLGLAIIVLGFLASSVAWYFYMKYLTFAILFATALIDVVLFLWVANLLQCYRCHAEYRGVNLHPHEPFHLETHERHRQQRARLAQGDGRSSVAPSGRSAGP